MSATPEAEEPRYTLAEAQQELRRQECARHGHSTSVTWTGSGTPILLICDTCGVSWPVGKREGC